VRGLRHRFIVRGPAAALNGEGMRSGEESLCLTPKGMEELRSRAHKLDVTARNILYLIRLGSTTAEAILQRTIFPRDAVIDKLRRLMGNEFVALAPGNDVLPSVARPPDLHSVPPFEQ
jgi:hypothetical protein